MRYLIACLALISTDGQAHELQDDYASLPCSEVVSRIDSPDMGDMSPKAMLKGAGEMAMAFGYLLGFEAAQGRDLNGESKTLLVRLREDCAASPDQTALEILQSY